MIDLSGGSWVTALKRGLRAELVDVSLPNGSFARLTVFSRAGLRIGYADFATGVVSADQAYEDAMLRAARDHGVHVVRFQAPLAVGSSPRYCRFSLQTAVIEDLQAWDERSLEKPRRTSNRMRRHEMVIRRGEQTDFRAIHGLYVDTVRRHGGVPRYSESYFSAIANSACWLACIEREVVAFVASGRSGDRGYYLHGGHHEAARKFYPSDLLFLTMLREGREAGLNRFDFLPSPASQKNLLAYKQAWGATLKPSIVSDCPLDWRGHAFSIAYAAMARLRRT